jgi:hypothetical protein
MSGDNSFEEIDETFDIKPNTNVQIIEETDNSGNSDNLDNSPAVINIVGETNLSVILNFGFMSLYVSTISSPLSEFWIISVSISTLSADNLAI